MATPNSERMWTPTVLHTVKTGITTETLSEAIQQIKRACYEKLSRPWCGPVRESLRLRVTAAASRSHATHRHTGRSEARRLRARLSGGHRRRFEQGDDAERSQSTTHGA